MARKSTRRRRNVRRKPQKTPRNTNLRSIRRTRPQARPIAGSLIATGVRNLISYLPSSSFLSPVADFILAQLGIASSTNRTDTLDVHITGGHSAFKISYVNILASSASGIRSPPLQASHMHPTFETDYNEARLISLCISLSPTSRMQNRSGTWTLGFWPFVSVGSLTEWDTQFSGTGTTTADIFVQDVSRMPHVVMGESGRTLTLTYRPRVHDGSLFQFNPVKTMLGGVYIRFQDYSRTQYDQLQGDEVGINCIIQGKIELRNTSLTPGKVNRLVDEVSDNLAGQHSTLRFVSDWKINDKTIPLGSNVRVPQSDIIECKSDGTGCKMKVKFNSSGVEEFEMLSVN